ncbi:helix-turn-helix transcriptional regulator [Colwellia demingiae]|uniref:Helix-turn-helix transcriptional regulator n=1 Tax=Colwellia demingiae TaxID=89401 RepID=A0A5C6QTK3_9GAMM|nr:AraC family transcriptional regulator [Colwellia demingiae]TWX72097.1 helix-turn-helix transcriptional regulator [Colwellia demingiae]
MEPTYLTLTPTLSAFIEAAKIHELNPYRYLAEYNIDPKKASTNERNLPLVDLIKLLNRACDELGSYTFVLTFVEQYEWDRFDAKVLALVQQDNLYTLTLVFNALLKEQGSGPELALAKQGRIASYHIKLPILSNTDNTVYKLVILVMWNAVMSKVSKGNWQPKKFLVSGTNNNRSCKNFSIYDTPVSFDQNLNAIEFDSSLLFKKLSMKVDKNKEMVKTYSEILGNVTTDSLTQSTIKMIIYSGDVSIEHVASILGTNPRMLQLKLKKLNTNFSKILASTRIILAKEQLQSTSYKINEIACHLAFNSSEAFVRFFKIHESVTPLHWRKYH